VIAPPLVSIPVGVLVERRESTNRWIDHTWRAMGVLPGRPETAPWTALSQEGDATLFYAGHAAIGLYRGDAPNYASNLASGDPRIWVRLRPTGGEPPYEVAAATADPTEGESFTEAGNDLVESVVMPAPVRAALEAFVAEHHVERPFYKRARNRADPEALSRRPPGGGRGDG